MKVLSVFFDCSLLDSALLTLLTQVLIKSASSLDIISWCNVERFSLLTDATDTREDPNNRGDFLLYFRGDTEALGSGAEVADNEGSGHSAITSDFYVTAVIIID